MQLDCRTCGACCAYDPEWPRVGPGDRTPRELVEDGAVRFVAGRCVALDGELGACVSCRIYARRPAVCRDCEPGSVACLVARRHHGLPVPAVPSTMDDLLG